MVTLNRAVAAGHGARSRGRAELLDTLADERWPGTTAWPRCGRTCWRWPATGPARWPSSGPRPPGTPSKPEQRHLLTEIARLNQERARS